MFKTAALNHNACVRPTRARQLEVLANRGQPAGATVRGTGPGSRSRRTGLELDHWVLSGSRGSAMGAAIGSIPRA